MFATTQLYQHPLSAQSHQSDRMTQIPSAIITIPCLEITYFKFCYTTIVLDSILITEPMIVLITIVMDQGTRTYKSRAKNISEILAMHDSSNHS